MTIKSLKVKILSLSVLPVTLTALIVIGILLYQKSGITTESRTAQKNVTEELMAMARGESAKIARDVYLMCRAQQEAVEQKVSYDLNVARDVLSRSGTVSFSEETVEWNAVDQFTKQASTMTLPKMMVGENWLGQNTSMSQTSPLVDKVKEMVGGTCTIFQRMNGAGDMLRVCTNVAKLDGTRAIGTYIPAINSDGKPNPVISVVMRGETFTGRAFVVNDWYITAYEPIYDQQRNVSGMLYVGVKQENVKSLRKGIMDIKVGKTGYVYVLGGTGDQKGRYLISKDGKRDGENIFDAKDADGNLFIQNIVNKALVLKYEEGKEIPIDYERYPWQNQGEDAKRMKLAAITYFEPWDWIICPGAYEDDYQEAQKYIDKSLGKVSSAVNAMSLYTTLSALVLMVICGVISYLVASTIVVPLNRSIQALTTGAERVRSASDEISHASQQLAEGANEQASGLEETSSSLEEMASMTKQNADNAKHANTLALGAHESAEKGTGAMQRMSMAIEDIKKSSDETAKIIKTIDEIAFQTNLLALNAAVEAARAGEAGKGFAVVAEEVRNLAQRSAEAAKNTSSLIEDSKKNSDNGVKVSQEVATNLQEIVSSVKKVTDLIAEVAAASEEQSKGIDQVNTAVSQMDKITQQNASNAEESASASEELNAEAAQLNEVVGELIKIVEGTERRNILNYPAAGKTEGGRQQLHAHATTLGNSLKKRIQRVATRGNGKGLKNAFDTSSAKKAVKPEEVIPLDDKDMSDF